MKLDLALPIADRIRAALAPHSDRVEIAGSVRRHKAEVGDIEIVAIPKTATEHDLFGNPLASMRSPSFIAAVASLGAVVKGNPTDGKYIQIALPQGIALDLFVAHPDNFGLIFAIRTGSADYSHNVLAIGWVRRGFHSIGGTLHRGGTPIPIREEAELFGLIGIPYAEPQDRNP